MEKILYTVSEVAEMLHVNKNYVYELINKRLLRAVKIGSTKIYYKDIINYIEGLEAV